MMPANIYGYTPTANAHENTEFSSSKILKRVLKLIRPHLSRMLGSVLLAVLTVVGTLLVPIRIGRAIDLLIETRGIGAAMPELRAAAIFAGIAAISQYAMHLVNQKIVFATVQRVRNEAFSKLLTFPFSYVDQHSQGDIASRMIGDADLFAEGLLLGFSQFLTGIMTIVGTLYFMFSLNVLIALIVVVLTPISLFVARFIAKHTFEMFQIQGQERGEQTALIDEALSNLKVVKAYGQQEKMLLRFDEINDRLQKSSFRAIFFSSLTNPGTRFVTNLVYALVATACTLAVCSGGSGFFAGLTVGILTTFLSYANQYMKPFNEISSVVTELQNALACAGRIFEIIDAKEAECDRAQAETISDALGEISVSHVDFSYDPKRELIRDLNLSIQPGMHVAIVGPTGCGKTTLINLLMRFYEVNAGEIALDRKPYENITLNSLRSMFGMVLQDTWLFSGTIRENIMFGKQDATEEEVIRAAKEAHAHSFIRRLPQGYETMLAEDGGILSQGQKQLLCISRLMLNKPPMLILDEATSSIDTRTEIKIQSAFMKLMDGKTAFIVAHRLSTIRDADLILVMRDGSVIEQGSHEELLQKGGFYSNLYSLI